jgi:hypothetical protein
MAFGLSGFASATFGGHGQDNYEFSANELATGAVSLPLGSFSEGNILGCEPITTQDVSIGNAGFNQDQVIAGSGIALGSPLVPSALMQEDETLSAPNLQSQAVDLGSDRLFQDHKIAGLDVSGFGFEVPSATMQEDETFSASELTSSAHENDAAFMVYIADLLSGELASGAIQIDTADITEDNKLSGVNINLGNPDVSIASMFEDETFDAIAFTSDRPVLGYSTIVQDEKFESVVLVTGAVSVPIVTMQEDETFSTGNINLGSVDLSLTPISQNHVISANGLEATASVPDATMQEDETLGGVGINAGAVNTPQTPINQDHKVSGQDVITSQVSVPSTFMFEDETFDAAALNAQQPINGDPAINQDHKLMDLVGDDDVNDWATGNVVIDAPFFNQGQTLAAEQITASSSVGVPELVHNIVLSSANINTGPSSVSQATMSEEETLGAGELVTGQVDIAEINPNITYDFYAPVLEVQDSIEIGEPTFNQGQTLSAFGITGSSHILPIILYDAALGRLVNYKESSVGSADIVAANANAVELTISASNKATLYRQNGS